MAGMSRRVISRLSLSCLRLGMRASHTHYINSMMGEEWSPADGLVVVGWPPGV